MGDDLWLQFNGHKKRKETKDETRYSAVFVQSVTPVDLTSLARGNARANSIWQPAAVPLTAIFGTHNVNQSPVYGNLHDVLKLQTGELNYIFQLSIFLSCFQDIREQGLLL